MRNAISIFAVSTLSGLALAQPTERPASEPQAPEHEEPAQPLAAEQLVPAQATPPVLERTTGTRLRFGADGGIGISGGSDIHAAMAFGGHFRLGAQLDDLWGVHYQGGLIVSAPYELGLLGGSSGLGPITHVVHTSSAVGELTAGNLFQIGVGPTFGIGYVARAPALGDSLFFGPGFSARLAFTFGGFGTGTRQGLSIAAQLDVLFAPDGRVFAILTQTFGWDTF